MKPIEVVYPLAFAARAGARCRGACCRLRDRTAGAGDHDRRSRIGDVPVAGRNGPVDRHRARPGWRAHAECRGLVDVGRRIGGDGGRHRARDGRGEGRGARVGHRGRPSAGSASTVTVDPQRGALLRIYEALGGPGWIRDRHWGTDEPIGSWWGVDADSAGNVVSLGMGSNGLTGTIPHEIGELTALRRLGLPANELTGPIPPEIGNLSNLVTLSLAGNDLTGPIPPELGNLEALRILYLQENRSSGPIPPELGDLQSLQYPSIDNTSLSGPLPRALMRVPLRWFFWYETGLCSPPDAEFQERLASLFGHRGSGKCVS